MLHSEIEDGLIEVADVLALGWAEIVHSAPDEDAVCYVFENMMQARRFFLANGVGFVKQCRLYVHSGIFSVEAPSNAPDMDAQIERLLKDIRLDIESFSDATPVALPQGPQPELDRRPLEDGALIIERGGLTDG